MGNSFFHLTKPSSSLRYNVRLGKGVSVSMSRLAETENNQGFASQYGIHRRNDPKEIVWERIRVDNYPDSPSRMNALFCFGTLDDAERGRSEMFAGEGREIVEIIPLQGAWGATFDSKLLDGFEPDWERNAHRYWSGEMTDAPFCEVIIHGAFYCPDWESFDAVILL